MQKMKRSQVLAKTPIKKPARKRLPRARYTQVEMTAIFERFRQQRPEPKGELNHTNPYTLVVAVLLPLLVVEVEADWPRVVDVAEELLLLLVVVMVEVVVEVVLLVGADRTAVAGGRC